MFTGASTADLAIVLVDARHGVVLQTRRHAQISALLGVRHVVAAVNKMDLVDWSQARFGAVVAEVAALAGAARHRGRHAPCRSARCTATTSSSAPSAPRGTTGRPCSSISRPSTSPPDRDTDHLRLPIQWVARPTDGRAGATSVSWPRDAARRRRGRRRAARHPHDGHGDRHAGPRRDVAVPPLSVAVELADEIDVGRGDDPRRRAGRAAPGARELDAVVCWMADEPLRGGHRYALKHTTRTVRATVQEIHDAHRPRYAWRPRPSRRARRSTTSGA